jgi:hypothetical protein
MAVRVLARESVEENLIQLFALGITASGLGRVKTLWRKH